MNTWDVSAVEYMTDLFRSKATFNDDIDDWDTSPATSLVGTFQSAALPARRALSGGQTALTRSHSHRVGATSRV